MEMPAEVMTAATPHAEAVGGDAQHDQCNCGQCEDCVACDAPCATGCNAAFNKTAAALAAAPSQVSRETKLKARVRPPHPEDLIRPPILIQS
jgi:hypothetical protein